MNIILLQPTDVLFFRDGRPMEGSLAGHTAAWPLPDVTNHALHAALHRAGFSGVHAHRRGRSGIYEERRDRKFGSLATAGPFPVDADGEWFFPRPSDAQHLGNVAVTLRPARGRQADGAWVGSSLPAPLRFPVGNTEPPSKAAGGEPWISARAFASYLQDGTENAAAQAGLSGGDLLRDDDLADHEATIGIAIDPETQTTGHGATEGKLYSAHYLRLREGFRLGVAAHAEDKGSDHQSSNRDLVKALFGSGPCQIVVGGQQRVCTAVRQDPGTLPLPQGMNGGFKTAGEGLAKRWLVKWVLLSPAVWPEIRSTKTNGVSQNPHPGGWLPNWVFLNWDAKKQEANSDGRNGFVLLTAGPGRRKSQRKRSSVGGPIAARLVAAIIPKPLVVTGWALPNDTDRPVGGAKPTHLAVPAGAVYYFEADSEGDARALANALNWHGNTPGTEIKNRRSTLFGEKGYGLGVCGTWDFYENVAGRPAK